MKKYYGTKKRETFMGGALKDDLRGQNQQRLSRMIGRSNSFIHTSIQENKIARSDLKALCREAGLNWKDYIPKSIKVEQVRLSFERPTLEQRLERIKYLVEQILEEL